MKSAQLWRRSAGATAKPLPWGKVHIVRASTTSQHPDRNSGGHSDSAPATYRQVFANREFRALYAAKAQSDLGDYLAKIALTFLVFRNSHSAALAAAAFGITYFPWIAGPLLATLADSRRRRGVMLACDTGRAALYALLAVPGIPSWALIAIAFAANLFSVPFNTARAALIPEVLERDAYVVASGLSATTTQVAQLLGFAVGGVAVLVVRPAGALLIDAATFLVSAALIRLRVADRPAPTAAPSRPLTAMAEGARHVRSQPRLLAYLLLIWSASLFTYTFEAQVAALATELHAGPRLGGLLLAAAPAGLAVGTVVLTRLVAPEHRLRFVLPLAAGSCLVQTVLWTAPPAALTLLVFAGVGLMSAYSSVLNALFVQAVAPEFRGRAMGIAIAGINLAQGTGAIVCGLAVARWGATATIGWFGLLGTLAVGAVVPLWGRAVRASNTGSTAVAAQA
jgi:predicted MFS family arabinose efflux permease